MKPLESEIIRYSYKLIDLPQSSFKHFSFLVRRNKIIEIGWNHSFKSNPINIKFKYRWAQGIHAEAQMVLSSRMMYRDEYHRMRVYNVRINNEGAIAIAAPCPPCQTLLYSHDLVDVMYTDKDGKFHKFYF